MVPSELGVGTLQRWVSVGLRLLDAVPVSCISPIFSSASLIPPPIFVRVMIYPCCSGYVETSSSTWPLLRSDCGNGDGFLVGEFANMG